MCVVRSKNAVPSVKSYWWGAESHESSECLIVLYVGILTTNKFTELEKYPLLNLDKLFAQLPGGVIVSKVDF